MQLILIFMAVQSAAPEAEPEQIAGGAILQPRILPSLNRCSAPGASEEIVVCGRRGGKERYRIPKEFRDQPEPGRRIAGLGSASLDAQPYAPCGIFQHQRKCSKADAAHFGYGNGRDPITFGGKIIAELLDPD